MLSRRVQGRAYPRRRLRRRRRVEVVVSPEPRPRRGAVRDNLLVRASPGHRVRAGGLPQGGPTLAHCAGMRIKAWRSRVSNYLCFVYARIGVYSSQHCFSSRDQTPQHGSSTRITGQRALYENIQPKPSALTENSPRRRRPNYILFGSPMLLFYLDRLTS